MKLLLDANLSPSLTEALQAAAIEVVHVQEVGLLSATDDDIFDYAIKHGLVVVTSDSDFPMMLALRRAAAPSVVLLRGVNELATAEQAALLTANLPSLVGHISEGAVVSLSPTRMRWRHLPLEPPES